MQADRSCLPVVGLLFLTAMPTAVHAGWWTELIGFAGDANEARVIGAGAIAARTADTLALALPKNIPAARGLKIVEGSVRAIDPRGRQITIAIAAAGGALALTLDGSRLLKDIEIFVEQADIQPLRDVLEEAGKVTGKPLMVIKEDGRIGRLVIDGPATLIEQTPGIFVDIGAANSRALEWALAQSFDHSSVRVISYLDSSDADVLREIDDAVGDLHVNAPSDPNSLISVIRKLKRRTIFFVGHVEGADFVMRDAAHNLVDRVPIAVIESAAGAADSVVVMLGCAAGICSKSAGFIDAVNAVDVSRGLKLAVEKPTLGEALSAIAADGRDLLIHPRFVNSERIIFDAGEKTAARDRRIAKSYPIVNVTTVARARAKELSDRIVPGIPTFIQIPYFIGLFLLAFFGWATIRQWVKIRAPPPRFRRRPFAYLAVHAIRTVGFFTLMPLAMLLFYICMIGSWGLALVVCPMAVSWLVVIPIVFGWKWWRSMRHAVKEEGWAMRYLAIPWVVIPVSFVVSLSLEFLRMGQFKTSANIAFQITYWCVASELMLIASMLSYRYLKGSKWTPADVCGCILAGPLLLIERLAARFRPEPTTAS
jgi:hypothetical protein